MSFSIRDPPWKPLRKVWGQVPKGLQAFTSDHEGHYHKCVFNSTTQASGSKPYPLWSGWDWLEPHFQNFLFSFCEFLRISSPHFFSLWVPALLHTALVSFYINLDEKLSSSHDCQCKATLLHRPHEFRNIVKDLGHHTEPSYVALVIPPDLPGTSSPLPPLPSPAVTENSFG